MILSVKPRAPTYPPVRDPAAKLDGDGG